MLTRKADGWYKTCRPVSTGQDLIRLRNQRESIFQLQPDNCAGQKIGLPPSFNPWPTTVVTADRGMIMVHRGIHLNTPTVQIQIQVLEGKCKVQINPKVNHDNKLGPPEASDFTGHQPLS